MRLLVLDVVDCPVNAGVLEEAVDNGEMAIRRSLFYCYVVLVNPKIVRLGITALWTPSLQTIYLAAISTLLNGGQSSGVLVLGLSRSPRRFALGWRWCHTEKQM